MVVDEGGIRMIKILDLFSGTQSVKKALDLMNIEYEYYGIDIYSPEDDNIILDLSQDNIVEKVIAALPKGFIPNFIWASPVCNKFSIATAVKGGNLYFEKTNPGLKVRENFEPLEGSQYKNKDHEELVEEANFHLKMVSNMQKILDHFNVDFVIENPYDSYVVYFLNPMYIRNRTDYCMYGYNYKKPTAIFSNYILDLKTCNHKFHDTKIGSTTIKDLKVKQKFISKYSERANVAPKLIIDILTIFLGGKKKDGAQ